MHMTVEIRRTRPIHGYMSRVQLGKGSNKSLQASKQQNTRSKIRWHRRTDQLTDGQTGSNNHINTHFSLISVSSFFSLTLRCSTLGSSLSDPFLASYSRSYDEPSRRSFLSSFLALLSGYLIKMFVSTWKQNGNEEDICVQNVLDSILTKELGFW